MSLFLRSPRTSQPQGVAGIDPSRGVVFSSEAFASLLDVSANVLPVVTGSITRRARQGGVESLFSSAQASFGDAGNLSGTAATFQILATPASLTQTSGLINKRASSTSNSAYSIGFNYTFSEEVNCDIGNASGGQGVTYSFSTVGWPANTPVNLIFVVDLLAPAGGRVKLWKNGVSVPLKNAPVDNNLTGFYQSTSPLVLGRVNSTGSLYYVGALTSARIINRAVSAAETKALSDNPWQLFKPVSRNLWIPGTVSGGSSHTLTGTNSTQSSTSGTGAVSQSHLLTGASCSQSATSGTGAITQGATHVLTGTNSTQAALSGTGAIAQRHLLTGAGSSQSATSGTGAIIAGAVHVLAAANSSQSATSSAAAITQRHTLISAPSVQDSVASASAIVQRHMLAAVGCSQAAVSGVGAITSTAPGAAVYPMASQVLAGVQYGPSGTDYTGTLTGGSGPSAADIAAAVWSYTQ